MDAKDGIWIIDAEGRTSYANDRMGEILGVTPSDMVGESSFTYVFPEDLQRAQHLFSAKMHGDANLFHFRLRRKNGSAVLVDVQGTPMFNEVGAFSGIVGTFTEVGESSNCAGSHL